MTDIVRQTIQLGHIAIWEEIARDGAQAKTLLTGEQRVKIARAQAEMFGEHGPNHVVFAVGYPSMCQQEFDAIRQVVAQVDNCSLVTHGRASRADIDLGLEAVKGASFGRVSYAIPLAESHSRTMLHQSQAETLQEGVELARYAVDKAAGTPIDVALGGAGQTDISCVVEAAEKLTEAGIATIKICDSGGERFPLEIRRIFQSVLEQVSSNVVIGAHLHNDFGLALANNLVAIQLGTRLVASSWLGLAERVGLAATEQLLFALSFEPEALPDRLGITSPLWLTPPDLKQLTPIAQEVSHLLDIPLKATDPIVGSAMNHVATGAYFNDPATFKPFDPMEVLGVPRRLILTHLANHGIVKTVASDLGYELDREQTSAAFHWVKAKAYEQKSSLISQTEFADYLADLTAS